MTIKGIELADTKTAQAIIDYIYENCSDEDEIEISGEDDYIYVINDEKFVIIPENKEWEEINNYNDSLFYDMMDIDGVPDRWRDYINYDKWIDDNGIQNFEEFWSESYSPIEYYQTYNRLNFYKVL